MIPCVTGLSVHFVASWVASTMLVSGLSTRLDKNMLVSIKIVDS